MTVSIQSTSEVQYFVPVTRQQTPYGIIPKNKTSFLVGIRNVNHALQQFTPLEIISFDNENTTRITLSLYEILYSPVSGFSMRNGVSNIVYLALRLQQQLETNRATLSVFYQGQSIGTLTAPLDSNAHSTPLTGKLDYFLRVDIQNETQPQIVSSSANAKLYVVTNDTATWRDIFRQDVIHCNVNLTNGLISLSDEDDRSLDMTSQTETVYFPTGTDVQNTFPLTPRPFASDVFEGETYLFSQFTRLR